MLSFEFGCGLHILIRPFSMAGRAGDCELVGYLPCVVDDTHQYGIAARVRRPSLIPGSSGAACVRKDLTDKLAL